MMFNLRRPDILPVDDLGVRTAVMRAYGMAAAPLPKELREFGERWKPHRTAASWYLWQSMSLTTMISEAEAKPESAQVLKTVAKKSRARSKVKVAPEAVSKKAGKLGKAKAASATGGKPAKARSAAQS
jgi:hypothetical protein